MKKWKVLILTMCMFLSSILSADILLWCVSGNEIVDNNSSLYSYLGSTYGESEEYGVRLAAYNQAGSLVSYLNPVYFDEGGNSFIDREFNDQYVGTRDDFWMT